LDAAAYFYRSIRWKPDMVIRLSLRQYLLAWQNGGTSQKTPGHRYLKAQRLLLVYQREQTGGRSESKVPTYECEWRRQVMVGAGNILFATYAISVWGPPSITYHRDNRSIISPQKHCQSVKLTAHLHAISKFGALAVPVSWLSDPEVAVPAFYIFVMRQHVSASYQWQFKSMPYGWPSIIPLRIIFRHSWTKCHYLQEM
jgi:hypothetical protein